MVAPAVESTHTASSSRAGNDNDAPRYLGVRYAESIRPYTKYPTQLCSHLTKSYLSGAENGRLLDLGCGRGEFLSAFTQQGYDTLGIDREYPNDAELSKRVRLCNLETDELPVESSSVDIIFNKSVFEHVREITPLLRECMRILRPGGKMISMVPDFQAQWTHFYDDWTHVRPFTLIGLRECLQSHDFELVDVRRFRQLPLLWERPYLRPLADAAALLPPRFKRSKWVRFSKEWMLLAVVRKPS